ncbi:MAG: hypothetical protein A2V64_11660 [Bacteroidetes bacterium RBG_13_43_22]|nr:MAG: hypothetical protein A2V64_11660 [Bacteroidetes bacterium RBG_13_43_22]
MTDLFLPDNVNIAGIQIIDVTNFLELLLRFVLNTGVIVILIRWLYYSTTKRKDYLFTYILISTIVFLLCFLLESVKLQIGFALGLFAIFGIIRYRTNAMPIKEMTYLFLIIGVSVINALTSTDTSLIDLLFSNIVIIVITFGLEKLWLLKHESSKTIIYEKINLIRPGKRTELLSDLQERTGISKINRVETGKIDFLRDTCELTIYYYVTEPEIKSEETNGSDKNDDDDDE